MWLIDNNGSLYNTSKMPVDDNGNEIEVTAIPERPEPYDDYIFDGTDWVKKPNIIYVPNYVTPLQARLALNDMGLRQAVEDAMLTATQDVKDFYEFALEWKRDNIQLLAMATSLGMDSKAIDDFFVLASGL